MADDKILSKSDFVHLTFYPSEHVEPKLFLEMGKDGVVSITGNERFKVTGNGIIDNAASIGREQRLELKVDGPVVVTRRG